MKINKKTDLRSPEEKADSQYGDEVVRRVRAYRGTAFSSLKDRLTRAISLGKFGEDIATLDALLKAAPRITRAEEETDERIAKRREFYSIPTVKETLERAIKSGAFGKTVTSLEELSLKPAEVAIDHVNLILAKEARKDNKTIFAPEPEALLLSYVNEVEKGRDRSGLSR